jgi:KDO2-lipid IV(A) lauroyltransferase
MVRLTVFLLGIFLWVFSLVPPRWANQAAAPFAVLLKYLVPRKRRVTRRNLKLVYPDLDDNERARLGDRSRIHYVRNLFDAGILWHWSIKRLVAHFEPMEGREVLREARAGGHGVIVAAPHFGTWELLNLYMQLEIVDLMIVYRAGKHPELEARLVEKRKRAGATLIPTTGAGLKKLYAMLKTGHVAGILPDQEPRRGKGVFVPFMGTLAHTGVMVSRLIQKTDAKLVFGVCERRPKGKYKIHFLPAEDAIYDSDPEISLAALNRGIEKCIEIDPAQYLWAYTRFRTRPEGEPPIY